MFQMRLLALIFVAVAVAACSKKAVVYQDVIPKHDSLHIQSLLLAENRVINIWLPPTYSNSTDSFSVLYMPDGGIQEDFPHMANSLSTLIAENKIPPCILVGIENTNRRRDLSGFSEAEYDKQFCPVTDGAKDFRAFIFNELMPEIEKNYRVSSKKGIIGESLAGLFIVETLFLQPELFDFYIAIDPSLWWNNHFLVQQAETVLKNLPNRAIKLWFAGSNAKDINQYTKRLHEILQVHAPNNLTWFYSNQPKEKHSTIFRATKEQALIWSMQNEPPKPAGSER